jgi:small subunit ribosomal protein S16
MINIWRLLNLSVKLRLRRMGKKKQPIYKVVVADARSPRDGKFLEAIGHYNPLTNPHSIEINEERANYWLNCGAEPTATVKSLLNQKGILLKRDLVKRGLTEDKVQAEMEKWTALKAAGLNKKGKGKPKETKVIEESTAEVKGAASEEEETVKE